MSAFRDLDIDTERKACCVMKIETGSSLYEPDLLRMLASSCFWRALQACGLRLCLILLISRLGIASKGETLPTV
jgi:hypothetical protein